MITVTDIQYKLLSFRLGNVSGWIGGKCDKLVWQGNKYVLDILELFWQITAFFHLRPNNAVPGMCEFSGDTAVLQHRVSAGA